jgi:hypothetical protein
VDERAADDRGADGEDVPTVLDEQAAVELARFWAEGEPIGLHAIPGGWVVWTGGSPDAPPPPGTGRRTVIDAVAEHMNRWPSWDVEEIAARLATATPSDRFPPNARAHLEAAGWHPGRRIPDTQLDQVARALAALPAERPIRLHDTARAFLAEFGALTVAPDERPALSFAPVPETFDAWLLDVPEDVLGQHFCPVAIYRDGWPSEILLGESGRSLLRAGPEFYDVADDPDTTVIDLLIGLGQHRELYIPDDDD